MGSDGGERCRVVARDVQGELTFATCVCTLVLEQPLLAPQAATVASQGAVRADDAMAGHDDAQTIVAVGAADRAYCGRVSDRSRDLGVRASRSRRNRLESAPYFALKSRAEDLDRRLEAQIASGEIRLELALDLRQVRVGSGQYAALKPTPQCRELGFKATSIDELQQREAVIVGKRINLTIEEARELAKRALKFKQERGRLPSITSPDAWEKRMAEGVAFLARMKAEAARV